MKRYHGIFEKIKSIRKIGIYSLLALMVTVAMPPSAFASSVFTNHSISSGYSAPYSVVSAAGSLWYLEADSAGQLDTIGNMTASGTIVANYDVRSLSGRPNLTIQPTGITAGPDGNIWFTGALGASLGSGSYTGMLNISTGSVTINTNSVIASSPGYSLIVGPDEYLYYSSYSYNTNYAYLVRVDSATGINTIVHTFGSGWTGTPRLAASGGVVWALNSNYNFIEPVIGVGSSTAYLPTGDTSPASFTTGPDGNLWLTANSGSGSKILKLTPGGVFTEYANTGASEFSTGPDGALWGIGTSGKIARISSSGTITSYTVPGTNVAVNSGMAAGPDGKLWFTYTDLGGPKLGSVVASPDFTNHSISSGYSNPYTVVSAAGSLWYLESSSGSKLDSIGNMDAAGAVIANYNIRSLSGRPNLTIYSTGMIAGPDGNIWFTGALGASASSGSYAGILNTSTGSVAIYTNSVIAGSSGYALATNSDGYLYYCTYSYNTNYAYLVRVDPAAGTSTISHTFSTGSTNVAGLASAGDQVWAIYSDHNFVDSVVGSGSVGRVLLPAGDTSPSSLVAGPDGNLWFLASSGTSSKVLKLTPSGIFTEYANTGISQFATGPDGMLWGTGGAGKIARMSTSGVITTYTVPGAGVSVNSGVTTGPDGALWFAYIDSGGSKLGKAAY